MPALLELWPRLRELVVEPFLNEDDYIERSAFQGVALDVQFLVRHTGVKPDFLAPGWGEHFGHVVARERSRRRPIQKDNSLEDCIERRREEFSAQGGELVASPIATAMSGTINSASVAAAVTAAITSDRDRSWLSAGRWRHLVVDR
jgi:hypothetical protein